MGTPKPGEIRCPTCHRSTPPATYCTQCGSPIPSDARARPRGLDRQELQDRIRQRRGVGDPYRRGVGGGYEPFRPEPGDEVMRRAEPSADASRVDHYTDPEPAEAPFGAERWGPPATRPDVDDAWRRGSDAVGEDATAEPVPPAWAAPDAAPGVGATQPVPPAPAPPPAEPAVAGQMRARGGEHPPTGGPAYPTAEYRPDDDRYADDWQRGGDVYTEPYEGGYPYRSAYPYEEQRGGAAGPLIVLGFLVLGVLALLGGAALAGFFGGDDGVAEATPTVPAGGAASEAPLEAETPLPEVTPPPAGTPVPSPSAPPAGDEPVAFDDGFLAEVQPCATPEMDFDGCITDGSTVAGDSVFVWVGFEGASPDELLQVLISSEGSVVFASQETRLGQFLSCAAPCTGYIQQSFSGLTPGDYEIELRRNGETADRAAMRVEG